MTNNTQTSAAASATTARLRSRLASAVAAFVLLAAAIPAMAADAKGRYAIKGAGGISCGQLAEIVAANDERTLLLLGWLDGYVTAENRQTASLFDAAPWQRVELMADLLVSHCKRRPDQPVFIATQLMLKAMAASQLSSESGVEKIDAGEGHVLEIYTEVLKRAQQQLVATGHLSGTSDGKYGPKTAQAFADFQAATGLKVTKLPDQQTLLALFRGLFDAK